VSSGGGSGSPWPVVELLELRPERARLPVIPVKPAISTSSVDGSDPCACSSVCVVVMSDSGGGNWNPCELSNGSPDKATNRAVHIIAG
jgi:hypothetical protein